MKTAGRFFQPEDYREAYSAYPAEALAASGIRALLCDIDNTLASYEEAEPSESVLAWIASLQKAGITVGLISNNSPERVERFNRNLELFAVPDACKPSVRGLPLDRVIRHRDPQIIFTSLKQGLCTDALLPGIPLHGQHASGRTPGLFRHFCFLRPK